MLRDVAVSKQMHHHSDRKHHHSPFTVRLSWCVSRPHAQVDTEHLKSEKEKIQRTENAFSLSAVASARVGGVVHWILFIVARYSFSAFVFFSSSFIFKCLKSFKI